MKTRAILSTILTLTSLTLALSCQKKGETILAVKPNIAKVSLATNVTEDYDEKRRDCFSPGMNCGPGVVIRPQAYLELHTAIQNNNISGYFTDSTSSALELYPGITQSQLAALQSGTYGIIEVQSGSQNNVFYLLTGPSQTISLTDFSFVVKIYISSN